MQIASMLHLDTNPSWIQLRCFSTFDSMRRVLLGLGITIDGYIARKSGAVDFLFIPKDYSMGPFFTTIDTAIMGRKTWDAASGGPFGGSSMATYVFSRSRPAGKPGGVTFVDQAPETLISELREKPGKHLWLMGGRELAREFLKADLVDELYLGVVPVLLGEGNSIVSERVSAEGFLTDGTQELFEGIDHLEYERLRPKT
jgi:dihydrofolate reductase